LNFSWLKFQLIETLVDWNFCWLNFSWLKLQLIETSVDWNFCWLNFSWLNFSWLKFQLIETSVDWNYSWLNISWLKFQLIETSVDWNFCWLKLQLIETSVDWTSVDWNFSWLELQSIELPDAAVRSCLFYWTSDVFPSHSKHSDSVTYFCFTLYCLIVEYISVSQPPARGPVPGPGINYTGPREVLLEFVMLVL